MTDLSERLQSGLADRYVLERELGHGGMATVYLARDLKHKRPVALKVLHPELAATLGPERFQREIELVARLQHPHILTVLDSGEAAGQLWFTMPYVDGESLRDRLAREGQLPVEDAVRITREAAAALDYAHRHDAVHRDIKPENILLTSDGDALVADFGIARALRGGGDALTQTGLTVGTPAYMSPEQASGGPVDARSDVYSLGTVLYEMLVGEAPYTGPSAQAITAKRLSGEIPSVRRVRPTVSEPLERAITKALARVPADRFQTAAEFAQALEGSATASTVARPGSTAMRVSRSRLPAGILILALGFLVGLGVLFAWRRAHARPGEAAGPIRVAVLPFDNLGDSADAYFADGVTDAVRGKLAAVSGLEVIASGSSNDYRQPHKPLAVIARELGVDYLLVGKVQWAAEAGGTRRVQVSPELVKIGKGARPTTKWQQPFDAATTDVFQVQADIAGRVAEALNLALGAPERQKLEARPTASLEAYDAFLRGEAAAGHNPTLDPTNLQRAIDYYERAVALDSSFADAWAQLARAQAVYYETVTPTPAGAKTARQAVDRANALAPESPAAALAQGDYFTLVRQDLAQGRVAYERGLKADPRNADLLASLGNLESTVGHPDSALALFRRAQAVNPRSVAVARGQAWMLFLSRRYREAATANDRALALAPMDLQSLEVPVMIRLAQGNLAGAQASVHAAAAVVEAIELVTFLSVYRDLVWVLDTSQQQLLLRLRPNQGAFANRGSWGLALTQLYYLRGDHETAILYADSAYLAFQEQLRATPQDAQTRVLYGLSLAYMGRMTDAMREGKRAVVLAPPFASLERPYVQHQLARIYLLAGKPEKALDQLEPLLKVPYWLSPGWLRIDPNFASLRGNPRFERLARGD